MPTLTDNTNLTGTITLSKATGTKVTLDTDKKYLTKDIELTINAPTTSATVSGATVSYGEGWITEGSKTVATGSATAPATISGTSATVSTGTNTLTLTKSISVTPSVTAGYVSSGTAGNSSVSLTASVTTKAAATITPGTTDQTIASGTYLTGAQTIKGDSNLVANNIKSGVSLFNITGTYTGPTIPSALGVSF